MDLSVAPNTELIDIRVRSDSPEEAAKIANALAERLQEFRQDQRQRLSLEEAKAHTNAPPLRGTIADSVLVEIVDLARAPTRPIRPNRPLAATIFFLGFLLVVVGIVCGLSDGSHPSPPTEGD
jgi:capsular polysaccharide biosynthesis protein